MINKEDAHRILLEETYRLEVRRTLEASAERERRKAPSPILSFLNTGLGLLLLSSVAIASLGWAAERYIAAQAAERERVDRIGRLDLEIGFRVSQILVSLYHFTDLENNTRVLSKRASVEDIRHATDALFMPPDARVRGLYPEFGGYSVVAAMAELWRLESLSKERDLIEARMADTSGFTVMLEVEGISPGDVVAIAGIILDRVTLPRWRSGRFYFLDCTREAPFC